MATKLDSSCLEDTVPLSAKGLDPCTKAMRGHNDARATTNNGLATSAVGPHTCHRLIIIQVYLETPIHLRTHKAAISDESHSFDPDETSFVAQQY